MTPPISNLPSTEACKTTGVRSRIRIPKARPNILEAGRRLGGPTAAAATSAVAKPHTTAAAAANNVEPTEPDGLKSPLPVKKAVRFEDSRPGHVLRTAPTHQPEDTISSNPDSNSNPDVAPSENVNATPTPPSSVAVATVTSRTVANSETNAAAKSSQSLTSTNVPATKTRERKISVRGGGGGGDTREKEENAKNRYKKGSKPPEKAKMTMFDLIYWNPANNPMKQKEDEEECRVPLSDKQDNVRSLSPNSERLAEERIDDPENNEGEKTSEQDKCADGENEGEEEGEEENSMPVPQVKIGPDGSIILDEQSLVIETTAPKNDASSSPAVFERSSHTTYSSYRKAKCGKIWSEKQTAKFYMALSAVGTDFSMMLKLFPKRTRNELKMKFKREDRLHKTLVDKAINDRLQYDFSVFRESDEEVENLERTVQKKKREMDKRSQPARRKRSELAGGEDQSTDLAPKSRRRKRKKKRNILQEDTDSDSETNDLYIPKSSNSNQTEEDTQEDKGDREVIFDHEKPLGEKSTRTETDEDNVAESNETTVQAETEEEEGYSSSEEILEGVLKTTRSGRNPKRKSVFTAEIAEPKRRPRKPKPSVAKTTTKKRRKTVTCQNQVRPRVHPLSSPCQPSQLILLAENPREDGSQIIHVCQIVSPPPVQSIPAVTASPHTADHNYTRPLLLVENDNSLNTVLTTSATNLGSPKLVSVEEKNTGDQLDIVQH